MNPHIMLGILYLTNCFSPGNTKTTTERINGFDLIGKFAKTMYPGKYLSGLLCWKTEKVNKLSLTLSNESVFFRNFRETVSDVEKNLVVLDMKCANRINKGKQRFIRNILFLSSTTCEELPDWSFNFPLVKIYILHEINNQVVQCSKSDEMSSWRSEMIGFWDQSEQFIKNTSSEKPSIANDEPKPIEVAYVASAGTALNIKDFRRNIGVETTSRFNYQLLNEVFTFLNLTPAESFAPNINSLEKVSSTSKELIAYPMKVRRDNFSAYDFLTTRTPNQKAFLLRAPSLSAVSNVFTLPLALNVWYASYILLAIVIWGLLSIVKVEWRFPDMISNKYRIMYPRLLDVVHMNIGAIAQQGSEAEPTSGGGRIATFLVFLFFLFLYTAYSANIVALLGSTTTRVHGVTDLKDFNVKLGIDKDDFARESFRNQDSIEHQALFKEKLARDECYMPLDEGIGRIRSEFFAFHGNSDKVYKMIDKLYNDNEKCGFVEIPYLSDPDPLIPIRKDSMYKEMIKIGLALFLERGMHNRIKSIMFTKQPQCYTGGSNFVSVALLDCYFAFVIYIGGAMMSFSIFLVEVIMSRSKLSERINAIRKLGKVEELLEESTSPSPSPSPSQSVA